MTELRLPLPAEGPLEPPPAWADLRRECPVASVRLPSGDEATLLTRYDDIRTLLSDPRFARPAAEDGAARLAPEGAGGPVVDGELQDVIPDRGEGHQRWRRQVGKYFTAKRMTALRPAITERADRLVDSMVEQGQPADLKGAFGFPLPVYVICTILGVPAEDSDRFSHWSDAFLNVSRWTKEESAAAYEEFDAYMSRHITHVREHPGDDLISMLIADQPDVTDTWLLRTGMGLLVAGHETTANAIGKTVAMLLADRELWELLLAEPELVRTTVDEALRLDVNLGFGLRRYLTEDVEVGGSVLPRGATIVCALPAANRDAAAFEDPDLMLLSRSPNPHLAFGAGPHACLGQSLARTELQVALEVLLRRLPALRLAVPVGELRRLEGLLVGGLSEVPVTW
ncbi:cytochrome P450 [Streptomyces acidiscabies]|uniref:Cytochrome P450 n=1 Tax=Streptomyces acidiscabies TaxID=42234 RepID=A0A0L0JCY5_9ACTN|nr:cytochrome P450 [Streptomyces acidiscabies]KND23329.1 cytochrome P450 [Streptomyces acidiscabies]